MAWLCLCLSSLAQAGALERALMPGPVARVHQKYEAECERCHASFDRNAQPQLCLACHEDTASDIQARRGLHGHQPQQPCAACHGADGKGTEAMKKNDIPDMTDKGWQGKHSKAVVVKAIADGIDGTKMKAFKDKLKPEEIDAIAVYVKKLK